MRKTQPAMPGFKNGKRPSAKECGQPLETRKGKKMNYLLKSPERNTAPLTSEFSPERPS